MMRPDVVLFGEMLPEGAFELAAERAESCDICLVVGTSMLVSPASYLPEIAATAGAYLVEVNPDVTAFSGKCEASLRGAAGQVIPELFSFPGS
jgi:NAD-dependent deacetylase